MNTTSSTTLPFRPTTSLPPSTEEELIESMLSGCDRGWIEFHRRYDRLIYRCITKVTGRFSQMISAEDIREIYGTLILQLLSNDMHKLRSFDPARGNRFGTWIGMLAINAAYDHLRTIRREPGRGSMMEAEALSCDGSDPFVEVDRKQREQVLTDLLRGFSAKDRQFVALYFDQGLEPEEVAARMRISIKTVYSKKHKIRTRLERLLHRDQLAA
ncbi:MAG TPA: sigma-70 family RNA polymerase sigma factor [Polyangiaceae bacterium]|nr:sigma-70 family RNA polymerase sigma factor [Polyangiaceae bacterium]